MRMCNHVAAHTPRSHAALTRRAHTPRFCACGSSWFDSLIILVILANCYTLAVTGRSEDSFFYLEPHLHAQLEYAFVLIFTGELGARAVAMGIFTDPYHVRCAPSTRSESRPRPPLRTAGG